MKHAGITIRTAARRLGQDSHAGRMWVRELVRLEVLERVGRRRVDAYGVASLRCYRNGALCWCGGCVGVPRAAGIASRERVA